ncbi:hypothetical protein AMATHDRAFT_56874 [Amanita thiersii Skay4041]|uniref:Kinetochore protein NDC80 n=1 Tax=Amanita thiersii Skay4041 TaxID=703135 RepID=A0A2A9NSQ8_9AGAR|nr:hypothetical protein AMATHDRAFT_56874 [Amanita thiersii Skay4041]
MDPWRRSVAQPPMEQHAGIRSGLPLPSTVKKHSQNIRMSVAGSAHRAPYPTPSRGPGNLRQSTGRPNTINNPLLMSTSRTPLLNSVRRGSLWPGGGAAMASSMTQAVRDTRPLRDRQYQAKMRQDIFAYLQGTSAEVPMATLSSIQRKEYTTIFVFLIKSLDPEYIFREGARFEDEFNLALRAVRYPYAHQIDSKWLAAPASMHSWPSLLGVLHWLVELCKLRESYLLSGHPTVQDPSNVPEEFDDPNDHRALAFAYYESTYEDWLANIDDFEQYKSALEERYAKKNEGVRADLEQQKSLLIQTKAELEKLNSSTAPIVKLRKENSLLTADSEKFQKILQQYEGRKKKLIDTIAYERAEISTGTSHLEQLKAEHEELVNKIKEQNLTPEEIIRMNTDRETLTRNLEDLRQKIAETQKTVMSLEVKVTNRVGAAEEALDSYTHLLSSLGLFPPLPPPWQDIDLTIELIPAASNPQELLSGADIREVIKPTLSSIAESKRIEKANLESERIKLDHELDKLTLECETLDEETVEIEKQVVSLNEQADDIRYTAQQEALIASTEAEHLEGELAQAVAAAKASGMGVKSRLQTLQLSYREQIERVARLKEETIRAIIKHSHDIAIFREEVSRHLRELREFSEAG